MNLHWIISNPNVSFFLSYPSKTSDSWKTKWWSIWWSFLITNLFSLVSSGLGMRKTDTVDKLALMKAYMKTLDREYTHVLLISGDKDFMDPINEMNNRQVQLGKWHWCWLKFTIRIKISVVKKPGYGRSWKWEVYLFHSTSWVKREYGKRWEFCVVCF